MSQEVQPVDYVSAARHTADRPSLGVSALAHESRPRTSAFKAVANWRATDTETTGWTSRNTYVTAYQPLTSHEAAGRRSSNGREGAGRRVRPPGTERAILAVHEGGHLNHLVIWSGHLTELLLQLAKMVPLPSFSTGLALSCADGLRPQGTQC